MSDSLTLAEEAERFPVLCCFGGGLNSTALLAEWVRRALPRIGRILFADTGGERPETYAHIAAFSTWLQDHGQPAVEVIRKGGRVETLEENCLRMKMLPSLAYGFKGCSHKYKIQPQEREGNRWAPARAAWKRGEKVVKLIGYGYEEQRRIATAKLEDDKYLYRFPLNEWRIDREACKQLLVAVGVPVPPKSSCFFCPASKLGEIRTLRDEHPELLERALHMERNAVLTSVKGLGRRFNWQEFLKGDAIVPDTDAQSCLYCTDDY